MSRIVEKRFKALGTYIYIRIIGDRDVNNKDFLLDLDEIENLFHTKEKIFSRFDSQSELYMLNHNLGKYFEVSQDIYIIAKKSLYYYKVSEGLFDPRVLNILEKIGYDKSFKYVKKSKPVIESLNNFFNNKNLNDDIIFNKNNICFNKPMDFSGIAKGYINDLAVNLLLKKGRKNFLINSGGDMYAAGLDENNKKWTIALEGKNDLMFSISNQAIATSGINYRKWSYNKKEYFHLINPMNPDIFITPFHSVSLIMPTTEEADVYAKIMFLLGNDAKNYILKNDLKAIILYRDGKIWGNN